MCVRRIADSVFWTCWPPAPGRAERVRPDLVPVELDLDVVVGLRHDLDQRERGLAAVLGVVRRDPDEAVDAALDAQPAVGEAARDLDRGALDAGLLAGLPVEDVGLEAVALAPAQVHALEHLGPVGGLGAAGARADRDDGVLRVVLAREQQQRALALELGAQARRPRGRPQPRCRHRGCRSGGRAAPRGRRRASRASARARSPRAGPGPRGRPSARRAGRPRSRARWPARRVSRRVVPWWRGQRRPEVDRMRSARSRMDAGVHYARTWRSASSTGRSSISRRAVLLRATTGFTQGQ